MRFTRSSLGAIRFMAVAIALNLLALPLYLLPGPNLIVYGALNGYLLGANISSGGPAPAGLAHARSPAPCLPRPPVVGRCVDRGAAHRPVLNLIAPVIATCFMVHLFEAMRCARPAEQLRGAA